MLGCLGSRCSHVFALCVCVFALCLLWCLGVLCLYCVSGKLNALRCLRGVAGTLNTWIYSEGVLRCVPMRGCVGGSVCR